MADSGTPSTSFDETIDPFFDNDWLQEHNLDVLFDLFEEEFEQKDYIDGMNNTNNNNNSSNLFGTSPVTSYLYGTSPTLASALDLYDWLYFDTPLVGTSPNSTDQSQHEQTQDQPHQPQHNTTNNNSNNNNINNNHNTSGDNAKLITNTMRIKRKMKKRQNEGTSLLARPLTSINNASNSNGSFNNLKNNINSNNFNNNANNNNNNNGPGGTKNTNIKHSCGIINLGASVKVIQQKQQLQQQQKQSNISDKLSRITHTKKQPTSLFKTTTTTSEAICINRSNQLCPISKQPQPLQPPQLFTINNKYLSYPRNHRANYLTSCAIALDHAYALRSNN